MSNDKILLLLTIYLFAASSILLTFALVSDKPGWHKWGWCLTWCGLFAGAATIAVRWVAVGHGPYISRYEVLISDSWVAAAMYLLLIRIWPGLRKIAPFVIPVVFLGMGAAYMVSSEVVYLTPSQRSAWLIIHVLFAKLTAGSLLVATGLSTVFLLKGEKGKEGALPSLWDRLPEPERCDKLSYKLTVCAFIFATVMIISGSIWGNHLWGSYWSWDPLETWSLVLWLVYGLFLHLRITYKFSGRKSAWYIIGAFVFTVFSFFILPFLLDSVHNAYMVSG